MAIYTVRRDWVRVVGRGWYGQLMAYQYDLYPDDVAQIGEPSTRDAVERWLATNSGDFQEVQDFWASIGEWDSFFATEGGVILYADCTG